LVRAGTEPADQGELETTPEEVDVLATLLQRRFGGRPIVLCVAQKRGALVHILAKDAQQVLFPVHPTTPARYRVTFCPSDAKDDPNDTAGFPATTLPAFRSVRTRSNPDPASFRFRRTIEKRKKH